MFSTSRIKAEETVCKEERQCLEFTQSKKREMKSQNMWRVVMCSSDDGLSSVRIARQLQNVVSERIPRCWKHSYKATGGIDLKAPPGSPRIAQTKDLTQKVKRHFSFKNRQRAGRLAKSLGVYKETMRRLIQDDLDLRAWRITTQTKLTESHKKRRVLFAYWVRTELRKRDHGQLMFTDGKYCSLEAAFQRQNERVDSVSREDADRGTGINQRSKYPRRIMIWLGASINGLTSLIIYQQDNATLQVHRKSLP